MGKGGGSPAPVQPTQQTVTQTNLPDYVKGDFQRLLARGEAESKAAYSPFRGQRIALPGQDIKDSESMVRAAAGQGIQGLPAAQAATAANIARAQQGQQFQSQDFDSAAAQKYMSPYIQNVINVQKQQAVLDSDRQRSARDAKAVEAGAFGGSRQGVQEALAQEALSRQLGDIQATGTQQAFEQAQSQFERDRSSQFAAEKLGLGAAELGGQQAAQLAELGKAARAGDVEAAQLLEGIGKSQMARTQAGLDTAYEDFVRQRDYPREQLQFMSSILRGVPVAPSTESQKFQAYNPIQQALGTGIAGLSLYKGLMG